MEQQNYNDFLSAITPMVRQLDRLEERTRDLATRSDLEALRKELVSKDSFEPQLHVLELQIARMNQDRREDKEAVDKRIDWIDSDRITRQERLWMRVGQIVAITAFALSLFEFLSHLKFIP